MRRHADPSELARSSQLVKAWRRRLLEQSQRDPLADEHWYAFLLKMSRPVPRPVCEFCEDTGVVSLVCSLNQRCGNKLCEHPDRRSDVDWTHGYARACVCPAGEKHRAAFERAVHPEQHGLSRPKTTSYGKATNTWRRAT